MCYVLLPCWLILLSGVLCPLTLLAYSIVRRAMSSRLQGFLLSWPILLSGVLCPLTLLANSVVRRAMSSQLHGFLPCWLILLSGMLCPLTLLANSVVRRAMSSRLHWFSLWSNSTRRCRNSVSIFWRLKKISCVNHEEKDITCRILFTT